MSEDEKLPDLLPWNFAPEVVLLPERILEHQAELIGQRSRTRLRGKVRRTVTEKNVSLGFVVSAPLLEYSIRLFTCTHHPLLPYPTTVSLDVFPAAKVANSEQDFRELVADVLGSKYVGSVFQSLLARIS